MCECCNHGTEIQVSHLHVQKVNCQGCLGKVQKALENVPGIVGIEHLSNSKEAKVLFDTKLVDSQRLEKIINLTGFEVE